MKVEDFTRKVFQIVDRESLSLRELTDQILALKGEVPAEEFLRLAQLAQKTLKHAEAGRDLLKAILPFPQGEHPSCH